MWCFLFAALFVISLLWNFLNCSKLSVCPFILRSMAKWLKDYLNFGTRRDPPQPPRPDYSESEILRAYRAQKELDFEDPYQHSEKEHQNGGFSPRSATVSLPSFPAFGSVLPNGVEVGHASLYNHAGEVIEVYFLTFQLLFTCALFQVKVVSPKHRLIKVDSQEFGCCKVPLTPVTTQEEPVRTASICVLLYIPLAFLLYSLHLSFALSLSHRSYSFSVAHSLIHRQILLACKMPIVTLSPTR